MSTPLAITGVRLIDPATGLDAPGALRIEDGKIAAFGARVDATGADTLDAGGLALAPGLIDLCVHTGEPGAVHRENLASAGVAAARGGVTTMLVLPDTAPAIDSPAMVDFVLRRARDTSPVRVLAAGALTSGLEGRRIAELGLMHETGAVAFSDGGRTVEDAGVLMRALRYATRFPAPVFLSPDTPAISRGFDVAAGAYADLLGLKGVPAAAEWIGLARDLILAEETGANLVVDRVSTGRSLDLVETARARGVAVACAVSAPHLFFNALDVGDYRTHAKLAPPLREESERRTLVAAFAAGRVDAIVSGHDPQPAENKRLPFAQAAFGAVGLETLLASILSVAREGGIGLPGALAPLTSGPAAILGLDSGRLVVGAAADLILFDPEAPWVCRNEELHSRSRNSPYHGRRLTGRVMRTIIGGCTVFTVGAGEKGDPA